MGSDHVLVVPMVLHQMSLALAVLVKWWVSQTAYTPALIRITVVMVIMQVNGALEARNLCEVCYDYLL